MKSIKKSVIKRIVILFCCTVIFTSNVFMSYDNTLMVKAVDDADLWKDFIFAALASIGVFVSGGTASTLALAIAPSLTNAGYDIYHYITQNEDGTTTISEDFVNLVLQAYKEYTVQNFDGNIQQDESTMYYVYGGAEYVHHASSSEYRFVVNKFTYAYPVAFLYVNKTDQYKYIKWNKRGFNAASTENGMTCLAFAYNGNPDSSGGGIFQVGDYSSLFGKDSSDPIEIAYLDGEEMWRADSIGFTATSGNLDHRYYSSIKTSGIPVYTSFDMMCEDFYSGDYTHADNYGGNLGQTSNYTGTYGGGDINVSTEKLNGIQDKLDEINEMDKGIDDKLKDLLEWLGTGDGIGGGGSGSTGTGGSTVDMSTTNSWLEKIYTKVCDIFNKMGQKDEQDSSGGDNPSVSENSVGMSDINNILKLIWANTNVIVEKLMPDDSVSGNSVSGNSIDMTYTNSVLDSIKAGMDEITELLKKIKGWTVADTILDGVDAISDLLSLVGDFLNDAGAVVSTAAGSLAETADMMKDKFPFSIPWDLAMLVGILQAEPRAPVFHLPLVIESYGIEESIDIDMSQFDALSVIMRSMLTILYAYGILNMTTKVLNIGGGNK